MRRMRGSGAAGAVSRLLEALAGPRICGSQAPLARGGQGSTVLEGARGPEQACNIDAQRTEPEP